MATYNISTLAELQAVDSHLADDCVLLNDIDASATRTQNEGDPGVFAGFSPIGVTTFTGSFDGGGFTISHLYVNRPTTNYCGLFGSISATGKTIKDVNLTYADILGLDGVGALAGRVTAGTITNCHVSGDVESVGDTGPVSGGKPSGGLGGFAGSMKNCTVADCSSSCGVSQTTDVADSQSIGGFVGHLYGVDIDNCTASGNVTATFEAGIKAVSVGGFVGISGAGDTAADFDGCYASGDVTVNITTTGVLRVGGFLGDGQTSGTDLDLCFAYGDVESLSVAPAYVGGFFGHATAIAGISKCGAEGDVESSSTDATTNFVGGFVGKTDDSYDDCYARGSVCSDGVGHADANIGGFAGHTNTGTLDDCYSSGAVLASQTNGGGFIGVDAGSTETNCFWDTETSNYATSAGDETGKTTVLMKTESTFTDAGWDFTNIWEIAAYTRAPGTGVTIWLSGVGEYEDFEAGTKDADSFAVDLTTTNSVLWIEALESLIAGTGGDEWKVGSNNIDTPITPTNFTIRQQTDFGGKNIQAMKVNEAILFVDFVGRKLREMTYSDAKQKFVAPDLSSLAEHITASGITSMALQKNPDVILWFTLGDGTLISMTYEREQNVVAWSKHPFAGTVDVQSVCVIPGASEDEVWLSIKRTMTGVNSGTFVIYIERMASRTFTDIDDAYFVDAGITTTSNGAGLISGLDHLEGETVIVLGDGEEYTPTGVVTSGDVTITGLNLTTVQVGLSSTYKLQPMRLDVSTGQGTTHGSIKKVSEIVVSFLNTLNARYGDSVSTLYEIDWTDERWVNNTEITGLFTGDVVVAFDGGFNVDDPIIISDSGAMPCTVRAMVLRTDVTGR